LRPPSQSITKAINAKNEEEVASNAQGGGGKLAVVKGGGVGVKGPGSTFEGADLRVKS